MNGDRSPRLQAPHMSTRQSLFLTKTQQGWKVRTLTEWIGKVVKIRNSQKIHNALGIWNSETFEIWKQLNPDFLKVGFQIFKWSGLSYSYGYHPNHLKTWPFEIKKTSPDFRSPLIPRLSTFGVIVFNNFDYLFVNFLFFFRLFLFLFLFFRGQIFFWNSWHPFPF